LLPPIPIAYCNIKEKTNIYVDEKEHHEWAAFYRDQPKVSYQLFGDRRMSDTIPLKNSAPLCEAGLTVSCSFSQSAQSQKTVRKSRISYKNVVHRNLSYNALCT
jgi:hypothetical protein